MTKLKFIDDELIGCAIRGSFQRARVYANSESYNESGHTALQERLKGLLLELKVQYRDSVVSELEHLANIENIADALTQEFEQSGLLNRNRFRIGIAQKALNLYLKYLWCLDQIKTPPHCPFDFGIIAKLPLSDEQKKSLQWTKLDNAQDYMCLVAAARMKQEATKFSSLSEWELEELGE